MAARPEPERGGAGDGFARDLTGAFVRSRIPTLIVEGRWDASWGERKPALFARQHPNATLRVFDRSAHFPFAEEPEAFFAALEAWLRERAAR